MSSLRSAAFTTLDYDNLSCAIPQISQWRESDEMCLRQPYDYLTAKSGKEVRNHMISAFNHWLDVPAERLTIIGRVVSMLHNASLLVDDVEDDSQLRRGYPVAHKIYGIPQVINTANYVYFQAFEELAQIQGGTAHDLNRIVTDELLNLHRGQGLDLFWRDTLTCPTEAEYIRMVNNKTGGLLRLAVRLMMANATKNIDADYIPIVNLIGIYFQIRDDYCNLCSTDYATNKGFAEDLTEGKFSFPIIHGIHANSSDRQLLSILQRRPSTPTLKKHAVSYLERSTGSFEYTIDVLHKLEHQIRHELAQLGGNQTLEAIIDTLAAKIHRVDENGVA